MDTYEITPEVVKTSDPRGFDPNKLIKRFGSSVIDETLLNRIVSVCGLVSRNELHPFLRRGIIFSHRDMNLILDDIEG
jgi:tryptophanyl-tRNA synthetase